MTTNQTIDGVPRLRGLLDKLDSLDVDEFQGWAFEVGDELRALLDAEQVAQPQGDTVPVSARWTDWSMVTLEVDGRHRTYVECGKLDQPQGEPVAKLTWEQIVGLVNEVLGCEAHKWPVHDVGHAMTGINFNSLARIIDRVKSDQPAPVAVVMSFDFEHPSSRERRTVALSKQNVFDGMEDYFYDKLGEQICRCEPVGETNVVDCSCDEYVHDFEIVKASLTS